MCVCAHGKGSRRVLSLLQEHHRDPEGDDQGPH